MPKKTDIVTRAEAILVAKRTRPSLTIRQIAGILGVGKSQVGRVLKEEKVCTKCGRAL